MMSAPLTSCDCAALTTDRILQAAAGEDVSDSVVGLGNLYKKWLAIGTLITYSTVAQGDASDDS